MGFSQAETLTGSGFVPDTAEERIVSSDAAVRAAEANKAHGLYEAMLLAVSFIFLLLGILPSSQPGQPSEAGVSDEEERETASPSPAFVS